MTDQMTVEFTPPDLLERMRRYPQQLDKVTKYTLGASMLTLQENVPPYPKPPPNSRYKRTGQLGRSLGSSMGGGVTGTPSINQIKKLGPGAYEGAFGTNLGYAPDVIGNNTQKPVHRGRWWVMRQILELSTAKINRLWENTSKQLAGYLDGMG